MFRALLWLLLLTTFAAWGAIDPPAVTEAQLDSAVERVNTDLAPDDPGRDALLKLYAETRTALLDYQKHTQSIDAFGQARTNAQPEAESILAELAKQQAAPEGVEESLAQSGLAESEQMIQVDKAELSALKASRIDIRAEIAGMPARVAAIRARLTELVGVLAELDSESGLMSQTSMPGGEEEARQWLARAERAEFAAEKAALDEELLSKPMRLELLKARLDKTSHDIDKREKRLLVLEERAGNLRKGEAAEAQAEAELVRAGAQGKHELVEQLAEDNAELTEVFGVRGAAIAEIRQQESSVKKLAEQLETDLKSIERKLEILGMTTAIGSILREQALQLPTSRDSRKALSTVADNVRDSSIRQIELEDERRHLRDSRKFVKLRTAGLDPDVAGEIGDDLVELAKTRRELLKKAIELENTYASALGDFEFTLRRYDGAVERYRDFISERLLWIPSRETFSMFRSEGLPKQFREVFEPSRWVEVFRALPAEFMQQPMTTVSFLGLFLLIYFTPRLVQLLQATGRSVGYVRSDLYVYTVQALGYSVLLAFKWPMLMLATAWLFEIQHEDSTLAAALSVAFARTALYFWGLEFLRIVIMPKGLAASHFRWPVARVANLSHRIRRLEQTFLPATFLVIFSINLYPREVGGSLGALGVCAVLLSLAHFFRRFPHFAQGTIDIIFVDTQSPRTALWGKVVRFLLSWAPVVAIFAVLVGYSYTAIEFALLVIRTVVLYSAILLFQELGLRWLRLARRRMVVKVREEHAQAAGEEDDPGPEEEILVNDPDLLSDEGTKLLNALVVVGSLIGIAVVWAEVFPALGILESVELWHQTGVVDGLEATIPVTLADVFTALGIAVFGWVVARRMPSLLEILLRQRMQVSQATAYAASRVFQYAVTIIVVITFMGALGGSWSQIQWAVAALSLGIGFGLQEIVANFISGLIILFEQPIRVGDTVTVGDISGTVTKIRIRATTVRDFDRRELLVPNKEFVTNQLLNWSLSDPVTRWIVKVGVAYGTDMPVAMGIVREVAAQNPVVLADPAPVITFDEFGDNSLQITLRFFIDDLDQRVLVASAVRMEINQRFEEAGIVVAFPQRDVHLDTSSPLDVRMVERNGEAPVSSN